MNNKKKACKKLKIHLNISQIKLTSATYLGEEDALDMAMSCKCRCISATLGIIRCAFVETVAELRMSLAY